MNGEQEAPLAPVPAAPEGPPQPPITSEAAPPAVPAPAPGPPVGLGLTVWLIAVFAGGLATLLFDQPEAASLIGLAGLFVAAHAADVDPRWSLLDRALSWTLPVLGALAFAGVAGLIFDAELSRNTTILGGAACAAGGIVSLLTLQPRFARGLVRVLFRGDPYSRTLRLAARAVLIAVLLTLPLQLASAKLLEVIETQHGSLFNPSTLGGGLAGYIALALASVGLLLRRDLRDTLERLGLRKIRARDLVVLGLGVAALYFLNGGADFLEHRFFPAQWQTDQDASKAIAEGLGRWDLVMLGLSAGIGEEITLRGALQPRLGVFPTSLLFALLHVQYSPYGMGVVLLLGIGLGIIRQRTSTTVAMGVHAIYDVLAVAAS